MWRGRFITTLLGNAALSLAYRVAALAYLLVAEAAAGRAPVSAKDGPHSIVTVRYEDHNDPNRHVQDCARDGKVEAT